MKQPLLTAALLAGLLLSPLAAAQSAPSWPQRFADAMRIYDGGDYAVAYKRFLWLSDMGLVPAQTMLGVCHLKGKGVDRDPGRAALWFLRAAKRGHGPAQLALADLLTRGDGLRQNRQAALMWLLVAHKRGDDQIKAEAQVMLMALRRSATAKEFAAAQADARIWRPVNALVH
jgi:uncharacterized protein